MNHISDQMDALSEMVSIGLGRAAGMLNHMVGSHVGLRAPVVDLLSPAALERNKNEMQGAGLWAVRLGFKRPFAGNARLVFPTASAGTLVVLLSEEGTPSSDLDEIRVGTLTEVWQAIRRPVHQTRPAPVAPSLSGSDQGLCPATRLAKCRRSDQPPVRPPALMRDEWANRPQLSSQTTPMDQTA